MMKITQDMFGLNYKGEINMANTNKDDIEVEDKAAAIGKELGADSMDPTDKEELEDFDIIEEKDEDDRPLAKERVARDVRADRKQLSSKEKRDLKKKKLAEKFSEKDQIIQNQQRQLDEMLAWKNQVEGRLTNVDKAKVDDLLNQNISVFHQAERDHAAAFTEGDGDKATKAMRLMYDAQKRIDQLQAAKQQYDRLPAKQQAPRQADGPDPVVVHKAKEWSAKNEWYNANGTDEDSGIAKAISGILANEGYDPKSNDFWEELDDRLKARGIGNDSDDDDEDDYQEEKPKRRQSAPPVGSGSKRGDIKGKKTITLPTSYIKMLKDNGKWDDINVRNKILEDRERILREAGQ